MGGTRGKTLPADVSCVCGNDCGVASRAQRLESYGNAGDACSADRTLSLIHIFLSGINASLEQGVSFHEALSTSEVFPKYVIDMIEIGETTGKLEEVLKALSTYYRREDSIRNSIKNAVTYPIIMIVLMFVIIFVMIAKVLPVFQQIYGELGSQLTGVAGAFMRFSMVLNRYMLVIVLLLAVAVVALVFFFKSNHGKRFLQKKTYAMALATGRFANCMSLAMSSGLDTDQGLLLSLIHI